MSTALTLFRRQDFAVHLDERALEVREEALACASLIQVVKDSRTRDSAIEAQRQLKTLLSAAEVNRVDLKKPVIQLGKLIDSTAAEYAASVQLEYTRIDQMVCEWESEQREAARRIEEARQREVEAERKRIEEEARKVERERMRVEAEKQTAIAAEQLKAQQAKTAKAREEARLKAEALQAAEAERIKLEDAKREEEAKRNAELLEQKRAELGPPAAPTVAAGQQIREVMDFTVTDIHVLYLHKGQQCVELSVKRAAILALINAGGVREIPGLKIFAVTKNRVSANQKQMAIDV